MLTCVQIPILLCQVVVLEFANCCTNSSNYRQKSNSICNREGAPFFWLHVNFRKSKDSVQLKGLCIIEGLRVTVGGDNNISVDNTSSIFIVFNDRKIGFK